MPFTTASRRTPIHQVSLAAKGYTHVFEGKLFNGPHANLVRWFLYPEIQDGARKPEIVLFWHVWLYLKDIWVDYYVFLVDKLNATIFI